MRLAGLFLFLAAAPQPALADDCSSLQGTWQGEISGRFSGPIAISFAGGCNYNWAMTALTTAGTITFDGKQMKYANAAGSRGTVTRSGKQLTFRNTLTGNNYTVRVTKR